MLVVHKPPALYREHLFHGSSSLRRMRSLLSDVCVCVYVCVFVCARGQSVVIFMQRQKQLMLECHKDEMHFMANYTLLYIETVTSSYCDLTQFILVVGLKVSMNFMLSYILMCDRTVCVCASVSSLACSPGIHVGFITHQRTPELQRYFCRMSIINIVAREILDSRGNPTVEVDLQTAKG